MSHDPAHKPGGPAAPAVNQDGLNKKQRRALKRKEAKAKAKAGCCVPRRPPAMICRIAAPKPNSEDCGRKVELSDLEFTPSVAMPAKKSKAMPSTPGVRYWLADTGCPVDLAGRKSLPKLIAECGLRSPRIPKTLTPPMVHCLLTSKRSCKSKVFLPGLTPTC